MTRVCSFCSWYEQTKDSFSPWGLRALVKTTESAQSRVPLNRATHELLLDPVSWLINASLTYVFLADYYKRASGNAAVYTITSLGHAKSLFFSNLKQIKKYRAVPKGGIGGAPPPPPSSLYYAIFGKFGLIRKFLWSYEVLRSDEIDSGNVIEKWAKQRARRM